MPPRHDDNRWSLESLIQDYRPLGVTLNGNELWYRAVKCESPDGYPAISRSLYPPKGSDTIGRAQLANSPVLYASRSEMVALAEIGATVGDFIQINTLRPSLNVDIPCHVVGAQQSYFVRNKCPIAGEVLEEEIRLFRERDPNWAMVSAYVDSILAELFRQTVEEHELHKYKITAFFANYFHGQKGGVVYPSVQLHGGINLALSGAAVDSSFEVLWTEVVQIKLNFGHGIYAYQPLKYSAKIGASGLIDWTSQERRATYPTAEHGNLEVNFKLGWLKNGHDHH